MAAMFFLLFLLYVFPRTPASTPVYTPTDVILLSCGQTAVTKDVYNRTWDPDEHSNFKPANAASISNASKIPNNKAPYNTARVFRSSFTYSIPTASTGHKFIRLHFYPGSYPGINTTDLYFSVVANDFTLLRNFSAFLNSPDKLPFLKEFIINVEGDQRINLTFSPNPKSFAFVNGIEVVSLPEKLYVRGIPINLVPKALIDLENSTALEMLYRLNVGGADVSVDKDTGMFRYWTRDDGYILGANYGITPHREQLPIHYTEETPEYTAPNIVYTTSRSTAPDIGVNLQWGFEVDAGFKYLLRFHFCEFLVEVNKSRDRIFTISINNETAEEAADVVGWTGDVQTPIFKDYVLWVRNKNTHPEKSDLGVSLFSNANERPAFKSAFLNGLEIFKLSDTNQSLAGANLAPRSVPAPSPRPTRVTKKTGASIIYGVVGSVIGVLAVIVAACFFIFRRQRKLKEPSEDASGVALPSELCKRFTLREITTATGNFSEANVIGRGGFGYVYKGDINDSATTTTTVAIKRLNASSKQGAKEFFAEIETLSQLRYVHLVSLIGYCCERREMLLVYEYMEHGTLYDHLHKTENPPLNWMQRLKICLGAAKGLEYLHTGVKDRIIHRDVKSTNILLDKNWEAKMSDFGLSKVGPNEHTHVSTAVKGSFGYIDPEYYKLSQLTEKSDVYSFGVVLLESLCGRPALLHDISTEQLNLAAWAKKCHENGTFDQIIDPKLSGQIEPHCLNKFVETAMECLRERGIERPSMSDVVGSLELAIQLQESLEGGESRSVAVEHKDTDTSEGDMFSGTSDNMTWSKSSGLASTESGDKLNSGNVFSEMMNSSGR